MRIWLVMLAALALLVAPVLAAQCTEGQDSIQFNVRDAEKMRLASNGRLGIGTSTPTNALSVVTGTDDIVANLTSADMFADMILQDPGGYVRVRNRIGEFWVYTDNDTYKPIATVNGMVGIGTSAPNVSLNVVGHTLT